MLPFRIGGDLETIERIRELKKSQQELYSKTRSQQNIDQTFIDDTFIPDVRHPHKVLRLGLGAEIVNSPAEQIVTANPQAFIEVLEGRKDAAGRISKVINDWIDVLRRQNPNPFKESVKNKLSRGENYVKFSYDEDWTPKIPYSIPIHFTILDPLIIYGSLKEDDNGIPDKVLVIYERQLKDVIVRYPKWENPKRKEQKVEWFEFYDKNTVQFEADDVVVRRQPNPYGIMPFVRKYSGFGRRSPDGEFANLIVSDIRNSRGLLEEICVMRSDIASVMHLTAHKPKTITSTGKINDEQIRENLSFETYDLNILDMLPPDFKIADYTIEQPSAEAFQHTANIMAELTRRHPYIMAGFPMGASGRQQSMADVSAMRRYDTIVENTENEWATAFEQAFRILKEVSAPLPEGLRKSDLDVLFKCTVKLKAKDPIEDERLGTLGSRYLLNKEIDPMTNLIEFKGYTQERAKQILTDILKWQVLLNSPDIAELIGLRAAEKSGMAEDLQMIKARRQQLESQKLPTLGQELPPSGQQRVRGEVQTQLGREQEPEGVRGARRPPSNYTRGQ